MKRFYSKIIAAVFTFILGLIGIWSFNVGGEIVRTLQRGVSENPDLIKNANVEKEETESVKEGLITIARGCGPKGYSQSYSRNDKLILSKGIWKMTQKEFYASMKREKVIEKVRNAKNRNGEKGMRIITKDIGKEKILHIYWYGKGNMSYISAQTLELALEFEKSGDSAILLTR